MQKLDRFFHDVANLIYKSDDILEIDHWHYLTVVYDISDGQTANSGFIYIKDSITPIAVGIDEDPMALSNKIREFRDVMAEETGKKFKQLLIQMERETGRIKIDFDFDKGNKWTIVPSRLKEMREELRPKFD